MNGVRATANIHYMLAAAPSVLQLHNDLIQKRRRSDRVTSMQKRRADGRSAYKSEINDRARPRRRGSENADDGTNAQEAEQFERPAQSTFHGKRVPPPGAERLTVVR